MFDVMSVRLHLSGVRVRGCWSTRLTAWKWMSSRPDSGRRAHIVGSSAARCGIGGPSGFVIWR